MLPLTLDHLVIAVRDLDLATENYQRLLGRKPSWHGHHPTYGTANVLFRIDNCYIELLGLSPDGTDTPWSRRLQERLDSAGEGLYTIALGSQDLDADVIELRTRGLDVADPRDGDGVDQETGARREWRNATIPVEQTRGIWTFLIQHRSPPDALPPAPATVPEATAVHALDHTVIASSHVSECLRLWHETLRLNNRLTLDRNGRSLHFLLLGQSILELAGETEPARPGDHDTLWGIAYRVPDVAATVQRLRAQGLEISDSRDGNAPDTVVADLKPGFSHDVRTLFIQKEVK